MMPAANRKSSGASQVDQDPGCKYTEILHLPRKYFSQGQPSQSYFPRQSMTEGLSPILEEQSPETSKAAELPMLKQGAIQPLLLSCDRKASRKPSPEFSSTLQNACRDPGQPHQTAHTDLTPLCFQWFPPSICWCLRSSGATLYLAVFPALSDSFPPFHSPCPYFTGNLN